MVRYALVAHCHLHLRALATLAMTPPTDSLEDALRAACEAVDVVVCVRGQPEMCPCCRTRMAAEGRASIPALAAVVREWMKKHMQKGFGSSPGDDAMERGYDMALADVARRLGLSQ